MISALDIRLGVIKEICYSFIRHHHFPSLNSKGQIYIRSIIELELIVTIFQQNI